MACGDKPGEVVLIIILRTKNTFVGENFLNMAVKCGGKTICRESEQ